MIIHYRSCSSRRISKMLTKLYRKYQLSFPSNFHLSLSIFVNFTRVIIYDVFLHCRDNDSKTIIDLSFREYLLQLIPVWEVERLKKYVQYNIDSCRLELSSPNLPVILLSDIFDMSTLEFCENLFSFVELNVFVWKEDLFFAICKNHLLRMCNGKHFIILFCLDCRHNFLTLLFAPFQTF